MLYLDSTKSFEAKPQFDRHFDSKSYWFLHNATILLLRYFGLLTSYLTDCVKPIQFLPWPPCLISWDLDKSHDFQTLLAFIRIEKPFGQTFMVVFHEQDVQNFFISRVRPHTRLSNMNIIFYSFYYIIWITCSSNLTYTKNNSLKNNKLIKYSKWIHKYTKA